jgi:hypothetical protein
MPRWTWSRGTVAPELKNLACGAEDNKAAMPRLTIKTGIVAEDGQEEVLTEYLCDWPADLWRRSKEEYTHVVRFPEFCSLPAVFSAPSLQFLVKAFKLRGFMSLGSAADIIPFTRFLECRQRRQRLASANATVVMPASTDAGIRPHEWNFER